METEKSQENIIEAKKRFIYTDHSKNDQVVFECNAKDILETDKKYQEATGNNPEKRSYVGCQILPNDQQEMKKD